MYTGEDRSFRLGFAFLVFVVLRKPGSKNLDGLTASFICDVMSASLVVVWTTKPGLFCFFWKGLSWTCWFVPLKAVPFTRRKFVRSGKRFLVRFGGGALAHPQMLLGSGFLGNGMLNARRK